MSAQTLERRLSSNRLEALADGIFAFSKTLTLLVLGVDMPSNIPSATANPYILNSQALP
jgi:uncharacterized membrane protein